MTRILNMLQGFESEGIILSDNGLEIIEPFAEGRLMSVHALQGQYRFLAREIDAEIEFLEIATSRRFVFVARQNQTVIVSIPAGHYRIWWRSLSRPGLYEKAGLQLLRLELLQSLVFFGSKLLALASRPQDILHFVRRALMRRSDEAIGMALRPVRAESLRSVGSVDFDSAIITWLSLTDKGCIVPSNASIQSVWVGILPTNVGFYADAPEILYRAMRGSAAAIVIDTDVATVSGWRPSLQGHVDPYRLVAGPLNDVVYIFVREVLEQYCDEVCPEEIILDLLAQRGETSILRFHASIGFGTLRGEADELVRYEAGMQRFTPRSSERIWRVSIIIPSRDQSDLLSACIRSLDRIDGVDTDIIIVDNGSVRPETAAYLQYLSHRTDIRIIRDDAAFNFSRLANLGAAQSTAEALLFLNDDIEALDSIWLKKMTHYLACPDVGVVGARLLYPSGDLQHAGIATNLLPGPGHPWRGTPQNVWNNHPALSRDGTVDAVTGACLLIRRDLFESVGGFDANAFGVTLNDVDLCLRVRGRGLRSIYVAGATLCHKEGQSRQSDNTPSQRSRRERELAAFVSKYPLQARSSCFYPPTLRRDTDTGVPL